MNNSLLSLCQRYVQACTDLISVNEAIAAQAVLARSDREEKAAAAKLHMPPPVPATDALQRMRLHQKRNALEIIIPDIEEQLRQHFNSDHRA